jgi:hypothetical protein
VLLVLVLPAPVPGVCGAGHGGGGAAAGGWWLVGGVIVLLLLSAGCCWVMQGEDE